MSNKDLSTFLTEWGGGQVKELIEPTEQAVEKLEPSINWNWISIPKWEEEYFAIAYTVTSDAANVTVSVFDRFGDENYGGVKNLIDTISGYTGNGITSEETVHITVTSSETNNYNEGIFTNEFTYYD